MLKYVREMAEARRATPGRRVYNYGMAAVLVALGIWVLATGAPGWIFLTVVAAEAVFDFFLVNSWVKEDAWRIIRTAGESA
ncbi:hypothetical protein OOZ51_22310 [Arthrobacter sp. MI7-26]|uniref:hypothetical protein n=1 Tax=Arthrobacter sp. MI7-26 TaxID=2993653 RepID=UPI002248A79F|nr:hypothetical protein [Arthrobacter sp. MI7-26]MCX2750512.1 hypothetical protein [Arthrobacter sp. MI7-26]